LATLLSSAWLKRAIQGPAQPRLMKSTLLTFAMVLSACLPGSAQLILNAGQTWSYQFNSLPLTGHTNAFVTSPRGVFELTVDGSSVQAGDLLRFEMFESGTNQAPACSGTNESGAPFTLSCIALGAWQDQQGTVRLSMMSGSITINSINLEAIVSGPSLSSYDVYSTNLVLLPPPQLSIARAASDSVKISWSTNYPDYSPEEAVGIPSGDWRSVTNTITTAADRFSVEVPIADQRFYRLRRP
jgi:hypothetical protein